MKLVKRAIDTMTYDKTPAIKDGKTIYPKDIRWDTALPGFGVRLFPTGRKSFVLSYRTNGRKRLMSIGTYGILTLDKAREMARGYLVSKGKEDPLDKRQRIAQGNTVKELCNAYLERYAKPHKKSWKDDERRINNRLIPTWGNLKASNINHTDVATLHRNIGKKHRYEANRTVELISKMFDLARLWKIVPDTHTNPARDIKHYKEEKRDRWVKPEELPKLAQAIDEEENLYARNALWLYLLTGVRKSELLKAKWEDIDLDQKELKIPETKNGKTHYIPLLRILVIPITCSGFIRSSDLPNAMS